MKTDKLLRAARFIRLIDEQNNISLTNIALIAVLTRILMSPNVDLESLAMFAATLIGYQVKRFAAGSAAADPNEEVAALRKAVETLQTQTTALQLGGQRKF